MNADERRYKFTQITESAIRAFYAVYAELGFGFVESVYREAMRIVLEEAGIAVVPVELKAVRSLEAIHTAQLLNGLRCSAMEVGLLLNFGPKPEIRRLAFDNQRKRITPAAGVNRPSRVPLRSSAASPRA